MNKLNVRLFFALFVTLVLTIAPLPELLVGFRPPWLLMFVLYIQFFLPNYFNITVLFILGLCLDALLSTVIGEHAFALLLTTWFAAGKSRRFYFYSMGQQMLLIGKFCLIYQLVIFLIDASLGYHNHLIMVFGTAILSMFFWPWIRVVADNTLWVKGIYR